MFGLPPLLVSALLVAWDGGPQPADGMEAVRQFYAAADYESALAEIEELSALERPADAAEFGRYRALCLIALGRMGDAETAIEQVLRLNPSYQPAEEEAPRVRSAYASVRARVLPQLTRAAYGDAKAAYDRRDYATATAGFDRTIALLDMLESADPTLGDLRTLASGFLDLSRAATVAAAPAPQPEPVASSPVAPPPVAAPPIAEPVPDAELTTSPPVVVAQPLPAWNPAFFGTQYQSEFRGAVEVTIDERGRVTEARIVEPIHPAYDLQLLEAARAWRYEPARLGQQPVASVKRVDVVLRPR